VGAHSDVNLAAMQAVARLSVLTRLRVASFPTLSSAQMPRCEELACLHSSSLQELHLSFHQVINTVAKLNPWPQSRLLGQGYSSNLISALPVDEG